MLWMDMCVIFPCHTLNNGASILISKLVASEAILKMGKHIICHSCKPPPTWLTQLEDNHQREVPAETIGVYVHAHVLDQSKHFKLKPFYALRVDFQYHTLNIAICLRTYF